VDSPQLAIDEPLSPELVLVLPPELRARVLASMRPPPWAAPRRQARQLLPPAAPEPWPRAVGALVVARVAQLGLIFLIGTVLTLAMSVVAHAFP
jgi:hypothetical protein